VRSTFAKLTLMGLAEIAFGLWLLLGRFEKLAAILSTIGIVSLATLEDSMYARQAGTCGNRSSDGSTSCEK
jgi:hypothetical protein